MARSEHMSPVDTTWLRMDRPTNRMVIVGVVMLRGPVDYARLDRVLAVRLTAFARFRQRVEPRSDGYHWCEDPHFEIGRHIRHTRLPGKAGKLELEQLVGELVVQPLDQAHPLWQIHVVEDYGGGAALIVRVHHAIADGIALVSVMLALTDATPDAPEAASFAPTEEAEAEEGPFAALIEPMRQALAESLRLGGAIWQGYRTVLGHPLKLLDYARQGTGIARELGYLAFMPGDTPTRLKGKLSGDKRVAWSDPLPLEEVKAVSHVLGCSVNDVLLAAMAGAFRTYLAAQGDPVAGVELRALVPVNLRGPAEASALGNHFGIVAVELPVGCENPLARLYEVHRRMAALKGSYEPPVTLGLLAALGYAPQLVQEQVFELLLSRATAVMTNVPGPQRPRYLAGARLDQVMFWVPQTGDIGLGVSILSFDGKVQFGLIADAALVPDPAEIIAAVAPEFEKLLYLALIGPGPEGR